MLTIDQCTQIATAIATVGTAIVAIYNARIAVRIATRRKEQHLVVSCYSGLNILKDNDRCEYQRISLKSSNYSKIQMEYQTYKVLEVRICNDGDLPLEIESIFISYGRKTLHFNKILSEKIFEKIDIGMSISRFYPFDTLLRKIDKSTIKNIYSSFCKSEKINLNVRTSFSNEFYCAIPYDFLEYMNSKYIG